MRHLTICALLATVVLLPMFTTPAFAVETIHAKLQGFNEVPAISSTGSGEFRAKIQDKTLTIDFELSYENLEGLAAAAHIHLGQEDVNGGVIAFLCGAEENLPVQFREP